MAKQAAIGVSSADIAARFPSSSQQRGRAYARQGRAKVESHEQLPGQGLFLSGRVRGSQRTPYRQRVQVHPGANGTRRIEGICSCPVGWNCKHVVALLETWLAQRPDQTAMEAPTQVQASSPTKAPVDAESASRRAGKTAGKDETPQTALPGPWAGLLDRLAALNDDPVRKRPEGRRLLFVLDRLAMPCGPRAWIAPRAATLKKDGTWQRDEKLYSFERIRNSRPKFITDADAEILASLATGTGIQWHQPNRDTAGYVLDAVPGALVEALLTRVLATGRAYWSDIRTGVPLAPGPARPAQAAWIAAPDGSQRFTLVPGIAADAADSDAPDAVAVLPLNPPAYVDPEAGLCGPLTSDLPSQMAAELLQAPPLPARSIGAFRAAAESRLGATLPSLPSAPAQTVERRITPVPMLRLFQTQRGVSPFNSFFRGVRRDPPAPEAAAGLWFRYGDQEVPIESEAPRLSWIDGDTLVEMPRDNGAEQDAGLVLVAEGLVPMTLDSASAREKGCHEAFFLPDESGEADVHEWLGFLHQSVPELQARGWRVEIGADFPYRVAEPDSGWDIAIEDASGIDWFGVSLGVEVDGTRMDLLPVIQSILNDPSLLDPSEIPQDDDITYVPMPDGRYLALPPARLIRIAQALRALFDPGTKIAESRMPPTRLGDLSALEDLAAQDDLRLRGGEKLRALAQSLRQEAGTESPATPAPAGLQGQLRDYQRQGLHWLQTLGRHGLGGILADDMGLGKTVQALAHVLAEKEAGRLEAPGLLVAPTSVVGNWRVEAQRFAPGLATVVVAGKDRAGAHAAADSADLILTSYALLRQDRSLFEARGYHAVICDEAQAIKNPKAIAAEILRTLRAEHKICLTGTPMENNLDELWSLLSLCVPGVFGDRTQFRRAFRTPIEKHGDAASRDRLARRVRPFLLRRRKEAVAAELPPRTESADLVTLSGAQRDLYETVRVAMDKQVRAAIREKGLAQSQITVLSALMKLRQVCCDPRLLKEQGQDKGKGGKGAGKAPGSAKLERLMALLDDLVAEERQVLVFSQFTQMLDVIQAALTETGTAYVRLDGKTKDRETPVCAFQACEVPVFLISLKAGGTGLNLTAADTVIHYDPWWNPAVESQASDRAHRIGQDKPVFIRHLIVEGTVEARMRELQARKRDLAALIETPDGETGPALSASDIDHLLAPLG